MGHSFSHKTFIFSLHLTCDFDIITLKNYFNSFYITKKNSIMKFSQSHRQFNATLFIGRLFFAAIILLTSIVNLKAQATLSVQGIVKKSNGVALEDGEYPITFKLYVVDSTQVKWSETIPNVELISGIYSVVLGQVTPLTLAFNKDYELGVSIGTQEMLPRIKLTSAPYALSLRGQTNQFPSTGQVLADEVKVAQSVVASGGAPGVNGVDKNGYAFSGNSGDNDSGLFSTGDGKVALYSNNVEKLLVTPGFTQHTGTFASTVLHGNQLNLFVNGGISYSSDQGQFNGWRLADVDDLSTHDGWNAYQTLNSNEYCGWNGTSSYVPCLCGADGPSSSPTFVGNFLLPNNREDVLKKQFTIAGSFTQIKVKFRYIALDTWDGDDYGFAGFSTDVNGSVFKVAWYENIKNMASFSQPFLNRETFKTATQIRNIGGPNHTDHWQDVEITARANGNTFWVFIGSAMQGVADESYALGPVEIWVR